MDEVGKHGVLGKDHPEGELSEISSLGNRSRKSVLSEIGLGNRPRKKLSEIGLGNGLGNRLGLGLTLGLEKSTRNALKVEETKQKKL